MADHNRSKKLLVRTGLVTGATVATLMSVQNLALLDAGRFSDTVNTSVDSQSSAVSLVNNTTTTDTIINPATGTTITHAAPEITVLRQPGSVTLGQLQNRTSGSTIQPPNAVLNPTSPTIIQQQSSSAGQTQQYTTRPRTRSSR